MNSYISLSLIGILVAVVANPIAPHGPMVSSWMAMSRPALRQEDQKQANNKSMTINQKELSTHNEETGPISTAEALEKNSSLSSSGANTSSNSTILRLPAEKLSTSWENSTSA